MRVAIADNNSRKFTDDLIKHWEKKHEVKYETGASEYLAQWADVYYIDEFDNNIHYLYKLYHDDLSVTRPPDWNNNKKPLIVCRPLDWTIWIGLVRDQRIIDWVDKAITIAPHLEKKLRAEANWKNLKLIRPGVNTEKFTLKQKKTDGFQVGMVLNDMWFPKQHMMGLDIFSQLFAKDNRWRLHIRGQHEGGNDFWKVMYDYYIESRGLQNAVTLYPRVEDMNLWLEDIDYLLHPGMKEGFCYAVGEAMSKGIKPVVNNFYGSKEIWYDEIIYNNSQEAIRMFSNGHPGTKISPSIEYRNYIKQNHSLETMLENYDEFLGL